MSVISFVEAPPGNGKSLYSVQRAFRLLRRGGVACFNFPLVDRWAVKYAERIYPHRSKEFIYNYAHGLWSRAFRFGTVESLYELSKKIPELVTDRAAKMREGQALAVFDEASLLFNSRDWQKNFPYIVFFINARKLKYHCLLMSHSHEDVDVQIQRKCELFISTRCMTKRKFCGYEISLFFKEPKFRVIQTIAGVGTGKGIKEDKEWFSLDKKVCDLYDTDHVFTEQDFKCDLGKLGADPLIEYSQLKEQEKRDALIKVRAASVINYNSFPGLALQGLALES